MRKVTVRKWGIWVSLLVVAVVVGPNMSDYHLTARGTIPRGMANEVVDVVDLERGKAFLIRFDQEYEFELACRVGLFWKPCGLMFPLRSFSATPLGAAVTRTGPTLVFAGMVEDARVVTITAHGEMQNVADHPYFLFSWDTDEPHRYLPVQALDGTGRVLYEIKVNEHGQPTWYSSAAGQ